MTDMDSNSVVSMLERMKDKVIQDEALAEAYGELANQSRSHEEKLNKVMEELTVEDELSKLKKEIGIN